MHPSSSTRAWRPSAAPSIRGSRSEAKRVEKIRELEGPRPANVRLGERRVNPGPGFVKAPRDRSARAVLDDRGLRVGETLERDEDDGRLHVGGQRVEHLQDARVRLAELRG